MGRLVLKSKHRMLCGDSTSAADVERLMGGERAALLFTSPPYGNQREYTEASREHLTDWDRLMQGVFANAEEAMRDDGQILVNLGLIHRDGEWLPYWEGWIEWMRSQGWRFGWYVWDQGSGMMGDWNGRLAPSFEFIFHFNKTSVQPTKCVETKAASQKKGMQSRDRMLGGEDVPGMRGADGVVKPMVSAGAMGQEFKIPDSVIRQTRHLANDIARKNHPATFPVGLPSLFAKAWPGIVYEPFSGSGTTLIAAEQLGQPCYAMELEPRYVDVAIRRYENLTGERAVKWED